MLIYGCSIFQNYEWRPRFSISLIHLLVEWWHTVALVQSKTTMFNDTSIACTQCCSILMYSCFVSAKIYVDIYPTEKFDWQVRRVYVLVDGKKIDTQE